MTNTLVQNHLTRKNNGRYSDDFASFKDSLHQIIKPASMITEINKTANIVVIVSAKINQSTHELNY